MDSKEGRGKSLFCKVKCKAVAPSNALRKDLSLHFMTYHRLCLWDVLARVAGTGVLGSCLLASEVDWLGVSAFKKNVDLVSRGKAVYQAKLDDTAAAKESSTSDVLLRLKTELMVVFEMEGEG
jgi:hypothetical protein